MKKNIWVFLSPLLCIIISCFFNVAISATTPSNINNQLIEYLNQVLIKAGFSDPLRLYIVNITKTEIDKSPLTNDQEKERTFKRNLYIFLQMSAENCQSSDASDTVCRQFYLSNQFPNPWDYILSDKTLATFKQHHLYDHLTIKDITSTYCQLWPFCVAN